MAAKQMAEYFIQRIAAALAPTWPQSAARISTLVENRRPSRWQRGRADTAVSACAVVLLMLLMSGVAHAGAVNLSRAEALRIGKKIWQNECAGTVSGLTSWNGGEN